MFILHECIWTACVGDSRGKKLQRERIIMLQYFSSSGTHILSLGNAKRDFQIIKHHFISRMQNLNFEVSGNKQSAASIHHEIVFIKMNW